MKNWEDVKIAPEFNEQGVACYRLTGADFLNEYYIISEAETRKLLNTPEIVGYEVYNCLISSTSQMLYYLKEQKKVTTANILSILRGALNYPLEESCYREHIRVHDISFLSSERVFENEEIAGLEIKYSKLTMVPDSTLMIGDIIASGETLIHCLRYVTDFYREHGAKLRNIIIFTIGGTKGIDILEDLTRDIREFWPEFEGFITVYYEGIFATYQDKGVSGINLPDVDFYWKGGIVAPEFRRETLSMCSPLFEKCIIYDGGARRYEIHEHVEEVLEFWEGIRERADQINFPKLLEEKLGYELPIDYEDWIAAIEKLSANPLMKIIISKPMAKDCQYKKIVVEKKGDGYQAAKYTEKQVFHDNFGVEDLQGYLMEAIHDTFLQVNAWDEKKEYSLLISKKGAVTLRAKASKEAPDTVTEHNRKKNYILDEGQVIPPLVDMGIFTGEGKVVKSMYDKFRQINRFIEMIDDAIREYKGEEIHIIDFGCGKSYLTFITL